MRTTRDGTQIAIKDMTDEHLKNTIVMLRNALYITVTYQLADFILNRSRYPDLIEEWNRRNKKNNNKLYVYKYMDNEFLFFKGKDIDYYYRQSHDITTKIGKTEYLLYEKNLIPLGEIWNQ